jgi:WD40 repeat protein
MPKRRTLSVVLILGLCFTSNLPESLAQQREPGDYIIQSGHIVPPARCIFSPDDRFLLTISRNGESILWNAQTGKQEFTPIPPHALNNYYNSRICEMSPDGLKLLSVAGNEPGEFELILQSTESGERLRSLQLHEETLPYAVKFSNDGRYIIGFSEGLDYVWETETGACIFSPDSPSLYKGEEYESLQQENREKWPRLDSYSLGNLTILLTLKHVRPDGQMLSFEGTVPGHNGSTVELSPDGRLMITRNWWDTGSSTDETVIWNMESGRPIWRGWELDGERKVFAFSPDGSLFIRGVDDQVVTLMDATTCEAIRQYEGHEAEITKLAYSPDGETFLSGDKNGKAVLWDVASGKRIGRIEFPNGPISSLAYSPDGQEFLVTGKGEDNNIISLCVTLSGQQRLVIPAEQAVTFSPDGTRILTLSSLRDASHGNKVCSIANTSPFTIELSPNGRWAFAVPKEPRHKYSSGHNMKTTPLRIWDTTTGEIVHTFESPNDYYDAGLWRDNSVQYPSTHTSDGVTEHWPTPFHRSRPRIGCLNGELRDVIPTISGLDPELKTWLLKLTDDSPPHEYFYHTPRSPSRKYLAVFGNMLGKNHVEIKLQDGQVASTLDASPLEPTATIFSADETAILVAYKDGDHDRKLILWDVETGGRLRTLDAPQEENRSWEIRSMTLSPNKRYAAICVESGYRTFIVDLESGNYFEVSERAGENYSDTPALFSPDSRRVYIYSHKRTLWDIETHQKLVEFGYYNGAYNPIFSPNGRVLFVQSDDHGDNFWDTETGEPLHDFGRQGVRMLRFNADGTRAVPMNLNAVASLWNFQTGEKIVDLESEESGDLKDFFFTPDGLKLITTHQNKLIVRDAVTGEQLSVHVEEAFPFDFGGNLQKPIFLDENKRLLTTHKNGAVLWDIATGSPLMRFPSPEASRSSAALSEGETRLLIVSPGVCATLWDFMSGEKLQTFEEFQGIASARMSEDGTRCLAIHRGGLAIRVWDKSTGEIVQESVMLDGGDAFATVFLLTGRTAGAAQYILFD